MKAQSVLGLLPHTGNIQNACSPRRTVEGNTDEQMGGEMDTEKWMDEWKRNRWVVCSPAAQSNGTAEHTAE